MERYVARTPEGTSPPVPEQSRPKIASQDDSFVLIIKDIFHLCLSNWYWFLLSIIVALAVGYYIVITTVPTYQSSISILIKSKDNGNEPILEEMGLTSTPSNLTNEMELLKTRPIAYEIAKRLNLNVQYIRPGKFHDEILYGSNLPLKVNFLDLGEDENASFDLSLDSDGTLSLSDLSYAGKLHPKILTSSLNDTIATPIGRLSIQPTSGYKKGTSGNFKVTHSNINNILGSIQSSITPQLRKKGSTIIDIRYTDASLARAEDILNTLVQVYNENWIKDRNQKTLNTDIFIKDRLAFIESELGDVEQSISSWKSRNLMLDVGAAGSFAQSQINKAEQDLQDLNNQVYMTKYIKDYLTDGKHENQLLPANSGITNSSIEHLISEYNSTLIDRNNHLANSSSQNPLVKDLDENLSVLRGSILQSLDYELKMLESKANAIRSQQGIAVSRVASNPEKAQQLLSVERQQKVKEQLYLYLLEKREENELSQAFGAYNNQFIESPHGSSQPVAPNSRNIMLMAFAVGLLVPSLIIAANELLNTKVRGKKDLKALSAPFAGHIPEVPVKKKDKKKLKEMPEILVKAKKRDVINEAFRVIRTNLEFILGYHSTHKAVMITSLTPGSGKTFITANLSNALAIRGQKVLAIDLDLRKGSLSEYVGSPKKGISNYLSGEITSPEDIIIKLNDIDVMPCGAIPPNPSELLFSPRFQALIEEMKKKYDYVFLDCPPVEIVADASIVSRYADVTLFVVRIGNLERSAIPEIEEWFHNKKYGNLAILLNGISSKSHYGYHKYGYHYGAYGYGKYGYGENK